MQQLIPLIVSAFLADKTFVALAARGPIQDAIQSGAAADYHKEDCLWRRDSDENLCPDPQVHAYLYTLGQNKLKVGSHTSTGTKWMDSEYFSETNENIFLVHGYNGGDDDLPIAILRDAYLRNGSYNVFVANWRGLGEPPCYPAAVANIRSAGKCLAEILSSLHKQGLPTRTTCVGHSLGAHVCGAISNFLSSRLYRIIGMDPAKPLIRPGSSNRLDRSDATSVQVIHTNVGYYGDVRQGEGHVNFCVNGGRSQPFCENAENEQLCSHNWSICFMADSIDGRSKLSAEPCTGQCRAIRRRPGQTYKTTIMGQHTPLSTKGAFCVSTAITPYCSKDGLGRGDERCCI